MLSSENNNIQYVFLYLKKFWYIYFLVFVEIFLWRAFVIKFIYLLNDTGLTLQNSQKIYISFITIFSILEYAIAILIDCFELIATFSVGFLLMTIGILLLGSAAQKSLIIIMFGASYFIVGSSLFDIAYKQFLSAKFRQDPNIEINFFINSIFTNFSQVSCLVVCTLVGIKLIDLSYFGILPFLGMLLIFIKRSCIKSSFATLNYKKLLEALPYIIICFLTLRYGTYVGTVLISTCLISIIFSLIKDGISLQNPSLRIKHLIGVIWLFLHIPSMCILVGSGITNMIFILRHCNLTIFKNFQLPPTGFDVLQSIYFLFLAYFMIRYRLSFTTEKINLQTFFSRLLYSLMFGCLSFVYLFCCLYFCSTQQVNGILIAASYLLDAISYCCIVPLSLPGISYFFSKEYVAKAIAFWGILISVATAIMSSVTNYLSAKPNFEQKSFVIFTNYYQIMIVVSLTAIILIFFIYNIIKKSYEKILTTSQEDTQ
jgi:hypothetical protein